MDTQIAIRIQTKGTRPRFTRLLRTLLGLHNEHIIQGNTLWESCRACLLSGRSTDTHIMVLQDDILPCNDFIRTAYEIVRLLPDKPITLFSNSPAIAQAITENKRWALLPVWFMAQAYIMPRLFAEQMVSWIDKNCKPTMTHDDDRMATYMWYNQIKVYATAPSLVEHIGWNETTLTTYKKNYQFEPRLRMASKYIGFEKSGLSIDWTLGLDSPIIENIGTNSMFCSNLKKRFEV